MKRICFILLLAAILLTVPLCFSCAATKITPISPKDDASVSLANKHVRAFYNDYQIGDGLKYYKKKELNHPKSVTFTWKPVQNFHGSYKLYVATNEKMKNAKTYSTKKKSYSIRNLYAGKTYYWYIKCKKKDKTYRSKVSSFQTKTYPRTVKAKGVSNVRDLGGWKTESGKVVRQGRVYRSARFDEISASGKTELRKRLRIKTDLDLRRKGEGTAGTKSPISSKLHYVNISAPKYSEIWKDNKQKTLVKEMKVFANEKNYPIVFHCTYGRDRTGTLAFTLNALLGVSKKDLYRDYELSFLSVMGSKSSKGGKHYRKKFDDLYKYMSTYPGKNHTLTSEDPLAKHVEQFLLDYGMKQSEIEKIRANLLR